MRAARRRPLLGRGSGAAAGRHRASPARARDGQAAGRRPGGYEYLMAGDDILLVSKGLHLVVDMIEDVMG